MQWVECTAMLSIDDYNHVFLDFDGVIKDSNNIKGEVFCEICKAEDQARTLILRHHINNPAMGRHEKIKTYLNWQGIRYLDSDIEVLLKRFEEETREAIKSCEWISGVRGFIQEKSKDKDLYVLTAMPQQSIENVVEDLGIGEYFSGVLGSTDTKANILRDFNSNKGEEDERVIFFGDSISDYEAAVVASVDFCLVGDGEKMAKCSEAVGFIKDFTDVV